ncbi:MAG: DUF5309 family protein [Thermoguttaceae bacterium]|nr:DUF5309 family protein [Thermoguttaceae bacterium]
MAAITTYDLLNTRIDLGDALSWRRAQAPNFIRLFGAPVTTEIDGQGNPIPVVATATEHWWLEGVNMPKTKTFKAFAYSDGVGTFTVDSVAGWKPGDLFHILGDSAVLRVSALDGETGIRVASVEAANGSDFQLDTYAPSGGGTLVFDSRPIRQDSDDGEDMFQQSGSESNFTQIFRGDVGMSGTALAVDQAGDENDMTYQVEKAMDEVIRRMNSALIFGPKRRGEGLAKPSSMGGLYHFGTQEGGLSLAQVGTPRLSIGMINRAAQLITDVGCVPDTIVCGTGQAQVISTFMNSQVTVNQADTSRGAYVEQIVSAAGGVSMKVFVEPAIPDGDVWVCDTRGFNLIPLRGRALHSSPATNPSSDGERAKLIGEYTAEFKNAKQALCRISGLMNSALAITQ